MVATGVGGATMSVLFKATDSVDFYYNSSLMGSFGRYGLNLGGGTLANITDGATDIIRFDGNQNVNIPNGDLNISGGSANVLDTFSSNITDTAGGNVTFATGIRTWGGVWAKNADLAEKYATVGDVDTAEIVATADQPRTVTVADRGSRDNIVGVVSTNPGFTLNWGEDGATVALVGRAPVKVNLDNGPIEIGDPITISAESGVGARATSAGTVVGTALEPYNRTSNGDRISVFVNPHRYVPEGTIQSLRQANEQLRDRQQQLVDTLCRLNQSAAVCTSQ